MAKSSPRIVVCGAGIAGISAAYHLAVVHGCDNVVIVEEGNPLSLTSDKSTEAYRNWWPGPDPAMTAFMNRSIDLIEGIARATGNRINLNRRGYLFATADAAKSASSDMAAKAEPRGGGPARVHDTARAPMCRRPSAASTSRSPAPTSSPTEPDPPPLSLSVARDRGRGARAPRRLAERPAARHGDAGGGPRARRKARARQGRGYRHRRRAGSLGPRRAPGRAPVARGDASGARRRTDAEGDGRPHRRRAADLRRAPPEDQLRRHARRRAARIADADLARRAASALERGGARRARRRGGDTLAACESFPPACTDGRTAPAPARHSWFSSTTTTAPRTSSFRCRRRRTMPKSRCAACRPWCRR